MYQAFLCKEDIDRQSIYMELEPSADWFSDSVMEDPYISIHQWELGSIDQMMSTQNIWENIRQPLSSESHSSYPCYNAPSSDISGSSTESTRTERPKKQLQPNSNSFKSSSCKLKYSTMAKEYSGSSPRILRFGNEDSPSDRESNLYENLIGVVKPKEDHAPALSNFSGRKSWSQLETVAAEGKMAMGGGAKRPFYNQEHIMAERKRREKLSMRFIALSAMLPDLKKMDKASVLGDTIIYMKQLQEKVKQLEEQTTKGRKSQLSANDDDHNSESEAAANENLPEIEARLSENNFLIKLHCENKKGVLVKALSEIEDLHLMVINTDVVTFAGSLHITVIAQVEGGFSLTTKDLVKNLRSRFRQYM